SNHASAACSRTDSDKFSAICFLRTGSVRVHRQLLSGRAVNFVVCREEQFTRAITLSSDFYYSERLIDRRIKGFVVLRWCGGSLRGDSRAQRVLRIRHVEKN